MLDPTLDIASLGVCIYAAKVLEERAKSAMRRAYEEGAQWQVEAEAMAVVRAELEELRDNVSEYTEGDQAAFQFKVSDIMRRWYESRMTE